MSRGQLGFLGPGFIFLAGTVGFWFANEIDVNVTYAVLMCCGTAMVCAAMKP